MTFNPDWCMHPGGTLKECLDDMPAGISHAMFAKIANIPLDKLEAIIACKRNARITHDIARKINYALSVCGNGPSVQFWINLEKNYRDGLKAGKKEI